MSYTQGPWTAKHVTGNNFAVQEFRIRSDFTPIFNKDRHAIDGANVFCSPEDAKLIAAAPDLLEALQDLFGASMVHCMMGDGKDDQIEAIAKARAAVAKATGERP